MSNPLHELGVSTPVLAAPMAGGPSTVELVRAAARAGSLGFIAGGYKSAENLAAQIDDVRASNVTFGVNLFVPNAAAIEPDVYAAYAQRIRPIAQRYGVDVPAEPVADDDSWEAKLDLLRREPVPIVSFTFGIPPSRLIAELRRRGTVVLQSVTTDAEARAAAEAGVDVLAVQSSAAGGHSATLTPQVMPRPVALPDLVAAISHSVGIPIIAAGGLAEPGQVAAVMRNGAIATLVGTALLRTPESGASPVHQAAVADPNGPDTVVTRAFTGRPARAIRNDFIDRFDAIAPVGYPAIHHLTSALRRASAEASDSRALHLWAGVGYHSASTDPTEAVLARLAEQL